MNYTSRFRNFTKDCYNLNYDSYITLMNFTNITKENLNYLWENIIDIFEPNKEVKFIVSGFEPIEEDFPVIYLSIVDKKLELNIANLTKKYDENNDKFPIWRLEHFIGTIKLGDVIIPKNIEIKELNNFLPIYELEF